jgi:putative pyruvate formate lyase activating enzyme
VASFPSSTLNREFSKFESLDIWKQLKNNGNNDSIRSNYTVLPWYFAVSINRMPAKYLISKSISCNITDLRFANEAELWEEHKLSWKHGKESDQQT